MKDPARLKNQTLLRLLQTNSRQLEESYSNLKDIMEILPLAKTAQERTSIKIVLDDQKKIIKSLERFASDLSGLTAV